MEKNLESNLGPIPKKKRGRGRPPPEWLLNLHNLNEIKDEKYYSTNELCSIIGKQRNTIRIVLELAYFKVYFSDLPTEQRIINNLNTTFYSGRMLRKLSKDYSDSYI
ncbi:hypothetical protein [Fluviispira sanaruensis]|uniref:Uncharacterized protein n=1 Tax=Fluviispira sanaruensis TaxID=2493639 RepID=A0A4V0P2X4_FLUSA|nr:hypothetical protein [Fluviispira sanaruensis]BBH54737.1 hypothetical protein JCM31447_32110 [Fluviispira sanaruensis]